MALFTGRGDDGTTKILSGNRRISKSGAASRALGALDEVNSFLGLCKVKVPAGRKILGRKLKEIIHEIQENLFIIQAETAGAQKTIVAEKVKAAGQTVDLIEKRLPPIKSFFVPGGPPAAVSALAEMAAALDFARTLARRAERQVVAAKEQRQIKIGRHSLAYLNRLSSLLYGLARLLYYQSGVKEVAPRYR